MSDNTALITWSNPVNEEDLEKLGSNPRVFLFCVEPYEIGDQIAYVTVKKSEKGLALCSLKKKHEEKFLDLYEYEYADKNNEKSIMWHLKVGPKTKSDILKEVLEKNGLDASMALTRESVYEAMEIYAKQYTNEELEAATVVIDLIINSDDVNNLITLRNALRLKVK